MEILTVAEYVELVKDVQQQGDRYSVRADLFKKVIQEINITRSRPVVVVEQEMFERMTKRIWEMHKKEMEEKLEELAHGDAT